MPRFIASVFLLIATLFSSCGLNETERAVEEVNLAIEEAEEASQTVASRLAAVPSEPWTKESFEDVHEALVDYLRKVEDVNAALRRLGEHIEPLEAYLTSTFRPAAESAASVCQDAIDTFDSAEASEDDYRQAVLRIGLCLDRYATAVTNVSAEYRRIRGSSGR